MGAPLLPAGPAEVAIDRRTGMAAVALLEPEATGEQRIPAGGIDQEAGSPALLASCVIFADRLDRVGLIEVQRGHAPAFDDLDALRGGVLQQDVVEF